MGSHTGAGGASAIGTMPQAALPWGEAGGVFSREVDGEGMVGPSGIAESTKNMASALGAMRGGPRGGQGAKTTGCPVAWLSGSIAPAKKKLHIYTYKV